MWSPHYPEIHILEKGMDRKFDHIQKKYKVEGFEYKRFLLYFDQHFDSSQFITYAVITT